MTLFTIIAAAMLLAALLLVLPPLLGRGRGHAETRRELNVAIFRERLAELDEDVAEGAIDEAYYRQARAELERDLLEDTAEAGGGAKRRIGAGRWGAIAVGLALPVLAAGLYWQLGAYHLIDGIPEQAQERGPSVDEMVARLAQRMEQNPGDSNGWVMLGRSYLVMERYDEAVQAYEKAYTLAGDEPALLADYAEALSMAAGASMAGRPLQLIKEALRLDPQNTKALWLAGIAAYQGGEHASAVAVWRKLATLLPADTDNARMVNDAIARVQGELRESSVTPSTSAATNAARVVVEVELAEPLRTQAAPEDAVFVFARASLGPPMPLAAVRLQVKDLPATITLDDSQAMMAERKLSSQQQVIISARVSKTGNAIAQPGDLQGSVAGVSVTGGEPVKVTIDQRVE